VFFEIGGEGTLTGPPGGFIAQLAKERNALLIALEHRFYGESIPNGNVFTENYKYLTVEQALSDLSSFTDFYKSIVPDTNDLKWFVFGGSYPGALSSWYRAMFPNQSVGSLSSSGVVNAIIDYHDFDMSVRAAAGNTCGNDLQRIQRAFQRTIESGPLGLQQVLPLFYCEKDMSRNDFYYMVSTTCLLACRWQRCLNNSHLVWITLSGLHSRQQIADAWSMMIQYSAKTQSCAAIHLPETASDNDVMQTFASYTNSFWGKDFCSGGFCKSLVIVVTYCIPHFRFDVI
jgi:pimeloyl-ACP methyl ester carboxylesterase